ncbi:MAG: class I SAM-dependent methyltransferase [Verrucomicrobiota bacterium]
MIDYIISAKHSVRDLCLNLAEALVRRAPAEPSFYAVSSPEDYRKWKPTPNEIRQRQRLEQSISGSAKYFRTLGFCHVCNSWTHFFGSWAFSYADKVNWREHLTCRRCGLTNRMRAAIHLLSKWDIPMTGRVYATEQTTRLFRELRKRCPSIIGSEFLGDSIPLGATDCGVMNQDLTRLTFDTGALDLILSFEVVEHIPDYRAAFRECARVLRPGGRMLFSTPFDPDSPANKIRARLGKDGTVLHDFPPEYHGDPLRSEGCLCFQTFGWEMLQEVREAGFSKCQAIFYYSKDYGYLGRDQMQFLGEK